DREPFAETPEPEPDVLTESLREPPHFARFQFLLGALLAVGVSAIVALGVIWATDVGDGGGFEWSAWAPKDDGVKGAQQIAEHVAPQYRLKSGEQMVHVEAGGLEAFGVDLSLVMRERPEEGGEIKELDGDTVVYRMCGLDDRCMLKGKPSEGRATLLRREALELALYSLRYLRGTDQVFVFLPTSQLPIVEGKKKRELPVENQGLLVRRSDVEPSLAAPLRATLDARPPALKKLDEARERPLLEALNARRFAFQIVPANSDDSGFLVLEQLSREELIERQLEADRQRQQALLGAGVLGGGG
ncbi:MAG TPA: hypothetical protein VF587_04440, partial [Solirubrobacteraceae bacterium]